MSQLSPEALDMLPLQAARAAEVALATDTADLAARVAAAVVALLPGQQCELCWLDGLPTEARPTRALLEQLEAGEPVPGRPGTPGYLPLRAGSRLVGWVVITPGVWAADQEPWLSVLAAVAAPSYLALRAAEAATSLEVRRASLRAELDRLRTASAVEPLLAELSTLIRRTLPFQHIYWLLRYRDSGWCRLAYASLGDEPGWKQIFWKDSAGLTGAVLASGQPLYTDNYRSECARRAITPILDNHPAYAWFGVPLCDGGPPFGALVVYSSDPQAAISTEDRALLLWLAEETGRTISGAQRYEQAAEAASQRETLNRITRAISSSLDPERVPALIVEQAPVLLNAEEASLLLLDESTGELEFRYASGPAGSRLLGQRVPAGKGVAGFVASSGEASIVNDTQADGRFYRTLDGSSGFQTRSIVAVPLRGIDGVKGVIEVLNRRDNAPFTEHDRVLLEALADQAMIALENARRFASIDRALARRAQELDRSNDRLRKILRASNALRAERPLELLLDPLAAVVCESSGFRRAMIALVVRERTPAPYLRAAALAGGPVRRPGTARIPLAELEPLLRPELRRGSLTYLLEQPHAGYAALWGDAQAVSASPPLPRPGAWQPGDALFSLLRDSRGELIGLLGVDDPEDGQRPGAEQVQILEILANQAAAAIENAHLYAAQQHSLSRMMALNGLGRALSTTLRSPQQIYELTASGMREMSGASWTAVFLCDPGEPCGAPALRVGPCAADEAALARLAAEAIAARRPLSQAGGHDGEVWIAIPLRGSNSSLGAICAGYADGPPDTGDMESLVLFASQAAAAVESLHLLSAVRQGRDQLASIMASTREGMLLVSEEGQVAVANSAFLHLAGTAAWEQPPGAPIDLAGLPLGHLLERWQQAASFPPAEVEQLHSGLAAVADGVEIFVTGQLNGTAPGATALEWSVLRATREGYSALEGATDYETRHWPILLTVRDITAAKEAERLRNDLTNMMVHDLRSPLTSIMTSIDMLFREVTGAITRQQRDILTISYASAQNLLNMVNLLLDISRLENGRMPLERAPLAAADLAERALGHMSVIAGSKEVRIETLVGGARVFADHDLLLRVLQNLIDNAIKFSPHGGQVQLSIAPDSADPNLVRFAVRDCGIGIRPQDQEKIFAKFGQAGNQRNTGSGLGLTFCKLVVEAHGGRIWVESAPGQGSTFSFTLPAAS